MTHEQMDPAPAQAGDSSQQEYARLRQRLTEAEQQIEQLRRDLEAHHQLLCVECIRREATEWTRHQSELHLCALTNTGRSPDTLWEHAAKLEQANAQLRAEIAGYRQAEEVLRGSEEHFRTVAEFAYDWEYWIAPDRTHLYVSPACERITGYRPAAFYANPDLLLSLVHPKDRERVADHLWNELCCPSACALEFRVIAHNGEEHWIGHVCQPVYDPHGCWIGRRASNRDITRCKGMEERLRQQKEALREANELLEKLFNTIHLHIASMDRNFNFIRVNQAYAAADGRDPSFFEGKNHFDLYPDAENEAIFRRVVETGEPYTAYARPFTYAAHPERGTTWWDWTLLPIRSQHGEVEGLVLCLVNVRTRPALRHQDNV
ncbi:MAG: PAS domain-containing protein [Chloroflexaceae bacterium]|nr:PAS domain-containing protein [Chloroflexaceae bacterium]